MFWSQDCHNWVLVHRCCIIKILRSFKIHLVVFVLDGTFMVSNLRMLRLRQPAIARTASSRTVAGAAAAVEVGRAARLPQGWVGR